MSKNNDRREEHMERRHKEHGSVRKAADEFGVSKSTLHRVIQSRNKQDINKGDAS